MRRLLIILISVGIIGCERKPEHMRGDLTPYLQWTNGTPVVIHLAVTKLNGEVYEGGTLTTQGILVRIAPDAVFIRGAGGSTNGFDKDMVVWMEKDSQK